MRLLFKVNVPWLSLFVRGFLGNTDLLELPDGSEFESFFDANAFCVPDKFYAWNFLKPPNPVQNVRVKLIKCFHVEFDDTNAGIDAVFGASVQKFDSANFVVTWVVGKGGLFDNLRVPYVISSNITCHSKH